MSLLTRLREKFPVLVPPNVKAEARVAIAQDVIKTLAFERMVAKSRHGYFLVNESAKGVREDSYEAVALSMKTRGKTTCTVCAIGAACLSAVSLYDKAEPVEREYDGWGTSSMYMRIVLARWFTRKQLDLIECAFEKSADFQEADPSLESRNRAKAFGIQHPMDSRERLEAIMQNVIDNDGTFKP
ncbi:MAG: hypothetical protein V3S55_10025 [Nitrospiraceae bacterium]